MRVAWALFEMTNEAGYAFPGRDTIAKMFRTDKRNVKDALKQLVELGYIRIEANPRRGPGRSDKFWLILVHEGSPIWARYREVQSLRGSLDPLSGDKDQVLSEPSRGVKSTLRGVSSVEEGGPETLRLLERSPEVDSSSEPNGSADAVAPAFHQDDWKGSEGDRIPAGFPDHGAMQDASMWAEVAGVELDLKQVRKTFLNHHFAVRCKQRDWEQSWERWVDQAITEAAA